MRPGLCAGSGSRRGGAAALLRAHRRPSHVGARFCPYLLRLHCFAGSAELRIHHTFVFDQEPAAAQLAAIGMHLPFSLGHGLRGALGADSTAPGEPRPDHVVEAGGALHSSCRQTTATTGC